MDCHLRRMFFAPACIFDRDGGVWRARKRHLLVPFVEVGVAIERRQGEVHKGHQAIGDGLPGERQRSITRRGRLEAFGGRARQLRDDVGHAVRGGTIWVNTFLVRDLTAPFGGVGMSGIGRDGSLAEDARER